MTNNSTVLALKYRPINFDQLIGQELIGETIYNSIKLNKVPNAYLLTGIRGTGKTSIARIIAKALNCKNGFENLCKDNFCENCEAITNSNHMDIFELDAASQSSVENTRELIEFSRYAPASSKYKIYILDECHMLSKQAWASLLKTLEEPPKYLKFIFATTEIKKVPITIVSRCQRFDLSRIKSDQLFQFIKKITEKEKGRVADEALKLIVKLSEGSVRDALSLLDRGLLSNSQGEELDLIKAQKIYGYFDKSSLIELFQNLFKGDENKVINIYRKIYEAGVEPKIFLNDFLEILYFIKNISSIKLDGNNFTLNDDEFNAIDKISKTVDSKDIILFWQFTVETISELEIVSNPNLCVEMFLVRLMYLKDLNKKNNKDTIVSKDKIEDDSIENKNLANYKIVDQIKNVAQQDETKPKIKSQETTNKLFINSFEDLIELCIKKKEIKLKYELEFNVNLVTFADGRIEIAFNEKLDKDFIKELSNKLYEWTNKRWIISLSKKKGLITKKQEEKINKDKVFENFKKSKFYNKVLEILPDCELIEFNKNEDKDD